MKKLIINRNEHARRPAPAVLKVLRNFDPVHASRYTEGYFGSVLAPKLAKTFNLPQEQILLSYGEEDFFRSVFDTLKPGKDCVLTHQPHYSYLDKYLGLKKIALRTFKVNARGNQFVFDLTDCLKQYQKFRPKVVMIASPNNPTANAISAQELAGLLPKLHAKTLVLLDEAYVGFNANYRQAKFLALIKQHSNLGIMRSFSKFYALAGLRVGFVLCGKKLKALLNYQDRYLGLSRVLEEAAVAALNSQKYYQNLAKAVAADRQNFIAAAGKLKNCRAFESQANFAALKLSKKLIEPLKRALLAEKVVIAKIVEKNLLRVTLGYPKHTQKLLNLLERLD